MYRKDIDSIESQSMRLALAWALLDQEKIRFELESRLEGKIDHVYYEDLLMPIDFLPLEKQDSAFSLNKHLYSYYNNNPILQHHLLVMRIMTEQTPIYGGVKDDIGKIANYFSEVQIKKATFELYIDVLFQTGEEQDAKQKSWAYYKEYNDNMFLSKYVEVCFNLKDFDAIEQVSDIAWEEDLYHRFYEVGISLNNLNKREAAQKYFDKLYEIIQNSSQVRPSHDQSKEVILFYENPDFTYFRMQPKEFYDIGVFYASSDQEKSCSFYGYALTNINYKLDKARDIEMQSVFPDVNSADDLVYLQELKVKILNEEDCKQ